MNQKISAMPLSVTNRRQQIVCFRESAKREEALERLIAVLETAVARLGRDYRPPARTTSDRLNQMARLSAAHAAYVLASRAAMHNGRGIRLEKTEMNSDLRYRQAGKSVSHCAKDQTGCAPSWRRERVEQVTGSIDGYERRRHYRPHRTAVVGT